MTRSNWQVYVMIVLLLAGCASPAPTSPISPLLTSPVNTPTATGAGKIVPFRLARPLVEGMDKVSGTGPAGVPVIIADVTFMGEPLGQGTIGPDNTFSIKVTPLEKDHRVGIMLGNLAGTRWKQEDFTGEYRGDQAMQVPQVAFFYDTAMVEGR